MQGSECRVLGTCQDRSVGSRGGRELRLARQVEGTPSSLPLRLSAALTSIVSKDKRIELPLPLSVQMDRHAKKATAASSMRAHLGEWLESEGGKAWLAERERAFPAERSKQASAKQGQL